MASHVPRPCIMAQPRVRLKSLAEEQWVMLARQAAPAYFDLLVNICRTQGFSSVLHEVRSVTSQIAFPRGLRPGRGAGARVHAASWRPSTWRRCAKERSW